MGKTQENLEATSRGETSEVGLYLAMAREAEREGHTNVVVYLRQLAMEEAAHAARAVELAGIVEKTKNDLAKMVQGEGNADSGKMEAARIAREEGNVDAARFFEEAAKDEARHKAGLEGIMKRFEAHGW